MLVVMLSMAFILLCGTEMPVMAEDAANVDLVEDDPYELDGGNSGIGCRNIQGVGNSVSVAGLGNTGRVIPNTLTEQMAMHQVQSNPLENAVKLPIVMNDSRWPASDGWVKMQSTVESYTGTTTIHFTYNCRTDIFDDFKIKD